jgi:hypothetical protein
MPIFGRKPSTKPDLQAVAEALATAFETAATDKDGRVRVEDLLSAAAAVCGEACIAAAGEFDPDEHSFTPGSPVMSDRVNQILADDAHDWEGTGATVFGIVRAGALQHGYAKTDFPQLADPIRLFAESLGSSGSGDPAANWGRVALSVPDANRPRIQPLRAAFELRPAVRRVLADLQVGRAEWPSACAAALVVELAKVRQAIDPGVATRIVLETVNGMAKTAPMTERHMREAAAH